MTVRIEYLDFQNLTEHREFRFRVHTAGGAAEHRLRIPLAAFGPNVRLQEGPDICYQMLFRTVESGEAVVPEVITLDEAQLAAYREAHTTTPRHRTMSSVSPTPRAPLPRKPARAPFTARTVAPPPVPIALPPAFQQGQRVRHAIFGDGVTSESSDGRTAVCFDQGGTRTFVTSILQLDVLSGPHVWETSARGVNRPRRTVELDGERAAPRRAAK